MVAPVHRRYPHRLQYRGESRDPTPCMSLHTGEAVVGNLASDQYMHYTAIGDTVNVAARLQSDVRHND